MLIKSTYDLIFLARRIFTIIGLCAGMITIVSSLQANTLLEVYFKNTEYELNIYRISGTEPGPTILIIGGIHNEPGGYLTADSYVDIALKRGNLIVVPRANFQTIIEDVRGVLGDMNRLFNLDEPRFENDHAMEIVEILKGLIAESDMMLNLHDGWGFYRDDYIDEMHNPLRLGQSIIADTDVYTIPGSDQQIQLRSISEKICTTVNSQIENGEHTFRFNNHNTYSEESAHTDQRGLPHSTRFRVIIFRHSVLRHQKT